MSTQRIPLVVLAATLLSAASLPAQELAPPRFDRATVTPAAVPGLPEVAAPAVAPGAERASADADRAEARSGGFSLGSVLHMVGGALVGGWVGYVGAQVSKSDWDKETNGGLTDQRSAWVAAGAAVGVVGSWLIGSTASPGSGRPSVTPRPSPRDRRFITEAEIRESDLQTALDVVRSLRSEWLRTRGANTWDETERGTAAGFGSTFEANITPASDRIIVYMDDLRIGGVQNMSDIMASSLTSIQFLDGRQATYMFGSGHAHGAILLSTEVEAP